MLPCLGCGQSLFGAVRYCPYCGCEVAPARSTATVATGGSGDTSDETSRQPSNSSGAVTVAETSSVGLDPTAAIVGVQQPIAIESRRNSAGPEVAHQPAAVPAEAVESTPPARPPNRKRWIAVAFLLGSGIGVGGLLWEKVRPPEPGSVAKRTELTRSPAEPAQQPSATGPSGPTPSKPSALSPSVTAPPAPKPPQPAARVPPTDGAPGPVTGSRKPEADDEHRRRDLADGLKTRLRANNLSGVIAAVDGDGLVTLSGVVDRAPDRERAVALTRDFPGVSRVVSALRIRTEELKAEIETGIRQALARNGIRDVAVLVGDDFSVVLRGQVDSQSAGDLATSLAWNYQGVTGVTPQLSIRER